MLLNPTDCTDNLDSFQSLKNMKESRSLLCSILPQRVILSIMGTLAIAAAYTIRSCISMAITEMVVSVDDGNHKGKAEEFLSRAGTKYNWTQTQQQAILSSFYVGYVISHIPAGLIAEKFGGKWTCSLGVLFMAICNAFTPLTIEYGGWMALIAIRILVGLGGGTTYPALGVLLASWVPQKERGKLGSFVLGGGLIGSMLSNYFSGLILKTYTWEMVYYFWSIVCVAWFILFTLTCSNDPGSHPFITEKELAYLKKEMGQTKRDDDTPPTPWISILTSVPVWAMAIGLIGHDWIFYIMSADMPKYFKDVLKLDTADNGLYSSLPFLCTWIVSILSGFLSDLLITRDIVSITNARKIFSTLGAIFPAVFLVAASYAGYDKEKVILMFTLCMGFLGNFFTGLKVNALDLSPNYSGSLMALTNGLAGMAGVVVLPIVGVMTPNSSLEEWRFVFWITLGFTILRSVIYIVWGSAEIQPWNHRPARNVTPECGIKVDLMKKDKENQNNQS
ncbi:sialin-like [Sitodiplosis mosellana]|uniref:sialin-like n=1 Tax=Sitodiplosis mosellana TaxID=263140 RepID=UPI0024442421|nr:sialin-like [Sitodiplosis mosellana]